MATPLPWLHLYTEARNDRKLETLDDAEFRVWFNLLCFSGEQDRRGTFEVDDSLAVEVARGDDALLAATIEKLTSRRLRILVDNGDGSFTFRAFDDRNKRKPSDESGATAERKRAQRERERMAAEEADSDPCDGEVSRPVTRSHAPVTHREEESRGDREEEQRENAPLASSDPLTGRAPTSYSSLPTCLLDERIHLKSPGKPTLPAAVLQAYERAFGVPSPTDLGEFATAIHDGCIVGCPKTPAQAAWCAEHIVYKLDHKAKATWKASHLLRTCLRQDREEASP